MVDSMLITTKVYIAISHCLLVLFGICRTTKGSSRVTLVQ